MEKDIRFTPKKVDESWKESVNPEPARKTAQPSPPPPPETPSEPPKPGGKLSFEAFLNSLGLQAFIHLGEIEHPMTRRRSIDLGAAQETIEVLLLLKDKTKGNLTRQEEGLLQSLLYNLQMKYVEILHHSAPEENK